MAADHTVRESGRIRGRRAFECGRLLLGALSGVLALAGAAGANSLPGDFAPGNSWWIHPTQGTLGVSTDGSTISIDRDGDGVTESDFDKPPALPTGLNLRLAPSRERLIAFGGAPCQTTGTPVFVYEVTEPPADLVAVRENHCIADGIDQQAYYDTGLCTFNGIGLECGGLGVSPQRIAYFVSPGTTPTDFRITWLDLDTGTVSTSANFDYDTALDGITLSPSGTHAFVKHGVPSATGADYRLVQLCPFILGQIVNFGGFPLLDQPGDPAGTNLVATVSEVAAGAVTIAVKSQAGGTVSTFTDADCVRFEGACCFYGGTCFDGAIEAECPATSGSFLGVDAACSECPPAPSNEACCTPGGFTCFDAPAAQCVANDYTALGEGTACTMDPCPMVDLVVDTGAPMSVTLGDSFTVTASYSNAGELDAEGAQLEFFPPFGVDVVSVSEGAAEAYGTWTWSLGTLTGGASGEASVVLRTNCNADEQLTVNTFSLRDSAGNFASDLDSPTIAVDSQAGSPIGIEIVSTPGAVPLRPDGVVTHTLTLTNPLDEARAGLELGTPGTGFSGFNAGISPGAGMEVDEVISDGGGTVSGGTASFQWQGSIPASSSIEIEFTTVLPECLPAFLGRIDETQLNDGADIAIFGQCGDQLGETLTSAAIDVEQDTIEVELLALGLAPPAILDSPVRRDSVQLARPGESVRYQLMLSSNTGALLDGAFLEVEVEGADITGPLVDPSDSGATLVGNTIDWDGDVPASGSVPITFDFVVDACRATVSVSGSSSGDNCIDVGAAGIVAAVPEPPRGDHLVALADGLAPGGDGFLAEEHVFVWQPGQDEMQTELCLPSEFVDFLGVGSNGDRWVGWIPTFAYNPGTLEIRGLDLDVLSDAGLSSVDDVAPDPNSDTVYFLGTSVDDQQDSATALLPYDPITATAGALVRVEGLGLIRSGVVDADGSVAAVARPADGFSPETVVRITPQGSVTTYENASPTAPGDVDLDDDGDYISVNSFGTPWTLSEVDPSGTASEFVTNLASLIPEFLQPPGAVAVDRSTGAIYLAPSFESGLARIDRTGPSALAQNGAPAVTGTVVIPFEQEFPLSRIVADMHFSPEPDGRLLGAGALVVLAWLRGRRRRAC